MNQLIYKVDFKKNINNRLKFTTEPDAERQLMWYGASFGSVKRAGLKRKKSLLKKLFRQ